MQNELEEKDVILKEKQPDFQVLETEFEDMNKEYDVIKKGIVGKYSNRKRPHEGALVMGGSVGQKASMSPHSDLRGRHF